MAKFHTILLQPEGRSVTGIEVPPEVVETLGAGKRPPVNVVVNGYAYRSTVAVMGGRYMISVSAENREAAGLKGGDAIEVELTLDAAPRIVDLPEDFAMALDSAAIRDKFDKLAPSHRKEHVRAINDAKTAETRSRRIEKAVEKIRDGKG